MEKFLFFSLGLNFLLTGVIAFLLVKNKKTKSYFTPIPDSGKTISKSFLKINNYREFKPFFDSLPEMLPVPENPVKKKNNRVMTEKEMTEGHQFLSKEKAFGLASQMVQDKKGFVWFEDETGVLCMVCVRSGDVRVSEFDASYVWGDGIYSFFLS